MVRRYVGISFALALIVTLALPMAAGAQLAGSEVKIGVLIPLTGRGSSTGRGLKVAFDIAQKEINDAGGIGGKPLKLIIYDTRGKNEEGVQITRRLAANDKVLAIAGPCLSGVAEVSFPVTNQMKIASVAVCSAKPGIAAKNRPWGFRNTTISTSMYARGIELWAKTNTVKKAAIIYDAHDAFSKTDGTRVFPVMAKKAGVRIVDSISFNTGDIDYSAQVTKIKAMKVDGLLIAGLKEEAAHIARESRRQGLGLPIFGGADLSGPKFLELAGSQAAEGIYSVSALWVGSPDPRIQKFVKKFKPLYGTAPHFTAAQAYDTTYILKKIIEGSGVTNKPGDLQKDRDRIRKGMEQLKNFPGLSGVTTMTKSGDVNKKILILVAKGGKFVLLPGQ